MHLVDLLPGGVPTCVGLAGTLALVYIYLHCQASDAYPPNSYVSSCVVQQKLMACPKYAEWLSVDGAGLFRRKTICKYINCEHIWNNSKSSTVVDVACVKCRSEGKEAFDFNESEVSVRFYTSMLAGKVSKSADSYTLQVQHLRVKM